MSDQTEKVSAEPPSGVLTDASSTREVVEMMRKLQKWNDARVAEGKKHQAMRSLIRPLQATLKRSGVWWHQHLKLLKLHPELLEFIGLPQKNSNGLSVKEALLIARMPQGAQMSLYTESRFPGSRDQRVDFLTERLDTYLLSQGQQRRPNVSGPLSPPKAPVVIRQVVLDVTPEPKASKPIPGIKQLIPVSTSLFLDILAKTPVPRPTGRSTTGAPDRNKPLTWEGSGVRVCGGKIAVIHNGKVIDR